MKLKTAVVAAKEAEEPTVSTTHVERAGLTGQRLHERLGSSPGSHVAKAFDRASKFCFPFTVVGGGVGTI